MGKKKEMRKDAGCWMLVSKEMEDYRLRPLSSLFVRFRSGLFYRMWICASLARRSTIARPLLLERRIIRGGGLCDGRYG